MKNFNNFLNGTLALMITLSFGSCGMNRTTVSIPAKQNIVLDYPDYSLYSAQIKNQTFKPIEVKVWSKEDDTTIRGFGLSGLGNAKVMVEKENQLVLVNGGEKNVKIKLKIKAERPKVAEIASTYVSFILENTSNESIPLWIPNVMNPNLSPNSKSAVELKYGQKIFFRNGMKKHLLLEVDEKLAQKTVIDVVQLLSVRKKEMGI